MSLPSHQAPSGVDQKSAMRNTTSATQEAGTSSTRHLPPGSRSRRFLTNLLWLQIIIPAVSICLCIAIFTLDSHSRKRFNYSQEAPIDGVQIALTCVTSLFPIIYSAQSLYIYVKVLNELPKNKFVSMCVCALALFQNLGLAYVYHGVFRVSCQREDLEKSEFAVTWEECINSETRLRVMCRALLCCQGLFALATLTYLVTLRRLERSCSSPEQSRVKTG
ncbi:hypothetical protein LIA77_10082 [Sarocladium implicatum]|nr:hypothetical protein LIA77_10082 [Sarocladium implicatum]